MVHVAYKGSAAYINDLIGGQVPSAIDTVADLSELHRAGRIRILATTGAARAPATPDVPTFAELGLKNVVATGWFGFFAPAEHAEGGDRHAEPRDQQGADGTDVVERLTKLGMDPATSTPEGFAMIVASDYAKWGPIVKASGFTADLERSRYLQRVVGALSMSPSEGSPGFIHPGARRGDMRVPSASAYVPNRVRLRRLPRARV